ncbi:MAG: 50S ribosomal protein L15 [Patescibacteria group bacterium]
MKLHEIKAIYKNKSKKRVGRGGKRGTYSGRGQKGQGSRSGHRIRPAERDLIMRLPKLRGIKHGRQSEKSTVINIGELENKINDGVVTKLSLLEAGVIKSISSPVKILGSGEIKKKLTIKGIRVSASARKKIEVAGGLIKK